MRFSETNRRQELSVLLLLFVAALALFLLVVVGFLAVHLFRLTRAVWHVVVVYWKLRL